MNAYPRLRPVWVEVDLGAVDANVRQIRRMVSAATKVFICLKCDAFGCGAVEVARTVARAGADGLAFGDPDLAVECRAAGVDLPMLVYPSSLPGCAPQFRQHRLMPTLSTTQDVRRWDSAANGVLDVFLKIDGGALRAGAFAHQAAEVAAAIHASRHLRLVGVYGHLIAYGLPDPRFEAAQIASIQQAFRAVAEVGPLAVRMLSSSESVLKYPGLDGDAVDPGRLAFGARFPAAPGRSFEWKPALSGIKSCLVLVKPLGGVGDVLPVPYFPLQPGLRIGLVPIGWANGLPRTLPTRPCALVRGRWVRLLPPVHAELTRVDLTGVPEADVGDEITLLGSDGAERITPDDFCTLWNTSDIELHTGIAARLPKKYLNPTETP